MAHRGPHDASAGGERSPARRRHRWRRLRRIPLAATGTSRRRAALGERGARGAPGQVAPGSGHDQGTDHYAESERRAGADFGGKLDGAAASGIDRVLLIRTRVARIPATDRTKTWDRLPWSSPGCRTTWPPAGR